MINLTIIGFGNVGASLALLLLNNEHSIRLNIIEPNDQREGAFLDLAHGMSLFRNKELFINDDELFEQADFVFHSAGIPNKHGGSRLSTAKENIELTKKIFGSIHFSKNPYVIVITNPVDIISNAVFQYSSLPAHRVIGTGTFLDSVRLSYYLSSISGQNTESFESFVLGEHGASQVPIYSMTKLNGKPILEDSFFTDEKLNFAKDLTLNAAYLIRETQKGTTYGVSKCAETLFNYLLDSEEHLLTLSVLTNEYYRKLLNLEQNIYISLPVLVKNNSIEITNEPKLSSAELEAFRESARIIAANIE